MKREAVSLIVVIAVVGAACAGEETEPTQPRVSTTTTQAPSTTDILAPSSPGATPTTAEPAGDAATTATDGGAATGTASSDTSTTTSLPAGWGTHSSELGYVIWLPPAWAVAETAASNDEVRSPDEAVLRVYRVRPDDEGIPPDQRTVTGLRDAVIDYFERDFAATLDISELPTLAGQSGYLVVMHYGTGSGETHMIDAGILDGQWWWELQWLAPAGTEEDDLDLFRQMIQGFSITSQP